MSRKLTKLGRSPKGDSTNSQQDILVPIMDIGISSLNLTVVPNPTQAGRQKCGACDRWFRPDFKGQKFCDHACYSASLRSISSVDRFWPKVNKNGPVARPGLTPCWLWTASLTGSGNVKHGQFTVRGADGKQRHVYAHRYSWELHNGPIPDGIECLHVCDVGPCVRPDHLFLGTQADNLADAIQKGRLDHSLPRDGVLTYADRLAIFQAPRTRDVGGRLAREYGVTKTTICMIRKGRFARPKQAAQPLYPTVVDALGPLYRPDSPFELVPSVQVRIVGDVR